MNANECRVIMLRFIRACIRTHFCAMKNVRMCF